MFDKQQGTVGLTFVVVFCVLFVVLNENHQTKGSTQSLFSLRLWPEYPLMSVMLSVDHLKFVETVEQLI